ncbi:MAG: hypothetical protein ACK4MH_07070 [Brevundimonas sp.]|uniref:hypothetical protein n=1 Tax=Brevundimonas sp. TaxID=1871086 RepID=UPI00391B8579
MDQHQPRIIARGEWEQNEYGDLLYIPRHKAPPMGDARGNIGPRQEGRDPDDLPVDEYIPGDPTDPRITEALASMRAEKEAAARHELARGEPARGEPTPTARGGYRPASDTVWENARKEYLAGDTAETVCARYGMGVSTFRARASDEGWRRQDQDDPAPLPMDEPIDLPFETAQGLPDFAEMAAHALVRMGRAVQAGRAMEAARWVRLHAHLTRLAREAEPPAPKPEPKPKEPDMAERATAVAREIGVIALEAAALTPGDYAGRDALMARVDALDDLKPPPISDELHSSDGVFAEAESETDPP